MCPSHKLLQWLWTVEVTHKPGCPLPQNPHPHLHCACQAYGCRYVALDDDLCQKVEAHVFHCADCAYELYVIECGWSGEAPTRTVEDFLSFESMELVADFTTQTTIHYRRRRHA